VIMVNAGAGERSKIRPVSGILQEISAGVRDACIFAFDEHFNTFSDYV